MTLTLLSEVHFWSTQEDVIVKHTDYGSFKYHNKKENETTDVLLCRSKRDYCESRNVQWNLPNKRPNKLKDKLKEFEDYLLHNKIVAYSWQQDSPQLHLLLSTGVLVTATTDPQSGDLTSLSFDKQLAAKLQVNILCDGIILNDPNPNNHKKIICICNDGHVLGFGGPWKDAWILEGGPRRHLNHHNNLLVVWGKAEAEHPQPWSPLGKDHQRANLHVYRLGPRGPQLLAYKKTDFDPIDIIVGKSVDKSVLTIEQKVTLRGSVSVEISHLELSPNSSNLKRTTVTSVPLQTQVSCCDLSQDESRLLIGCVDGSLALLDRQRGCTKSTKCHFIAKFAKWHPDGAVVLVSNDRGQLQYFDTALNCLKVQNVAEDLTPGSTIDLSVYFQSQFTISSVTWGPRNLLIALEQGPVVMLTHKSNLTFQGIATRYLTVGNVDHAIRLLLSQNFDSDEHYRVLQKIVAHLLSRSNFNSDTAHLIQDALGCFHSPPVPLKGDVRSRFGGRVYALTRRFFHHLVRAEMFETAFLLAVDLSHHDLFMDLHYVAVQRGEREMAAAARAQASALLSRCSSEASECSRSSCSLDDDDEVVNNNKSAPRQPSDESMLMSTSFHRNDYSKAAYAPPVSLLQSTSFYVHDSLKFNPANKRGNPPKATYVRAPQVPPLPNLALTRGPASAPKTSDYFGSGTERVNVGLNKISLSNAGNGSRKISAPPKVKFSDTVTAFIVPEVVKKRAIPARVGLPPPPPHLTDPRKELADSLPLCHPNEDYLKDFAPVRRDVGSGLSDERDEGAPKIKVVHFGVV